MSTIMQINPFEFFVDRDGDPLDAGYIWIGEANKYPKNFPVTVYYDAALLTPAPNPLRTSNGYVVRNGSPTYLYVDGNYSILVEDSTGQQVFYVADFLMIGSGSAISAGDLANTSDVTKGDAMVGVKQPYTGTIARTQHEKNMDFVTAADFGAVGLGADETVQLKAARDAGLGPVGLIAGRTYRISSQIAATGDNQGFFVIGGGWATVIMLTGAGQFDRATYGGSRYDTNACGFLCEGFDNYRMSGLKITLDAPVAVRTCKALAVRDSKGSFVDIEAYGFKECENGIVHFDSCEAGDFRVWAHDSGTSDDSLGTMQITGVDIDNTRIGSIYTTDTRVDVVAERILLTGAALTKYNQQTDGVNVSGSGGPNHGLIIKLTAEDIGEAIDIFGSFINATVDANNCWFSGVKLIHGARHNIINANINRTGGAAIVLGSSNVASQTVAWNIINATIAKVGNISTVGTRKCALQTDGNTAIYQPEYNHVRLVAFNDGMMDYVISDEAGSNNTFEYDFNTVSIAEITSPSNLNTIRRLGAHAGSYADNRYYGGGFLDLSTANTQAYSANTLYFAPFEVTDAHSFKAAGILVTTTGAGSARLGVYRMERGLPTTLVKDFATVPVTGAGFVSISINAGAGVWLAPAMYCLAIVSDVAFGIRATASSTALLGAIGSTTPTGIEICMQAAFAFANLPATAPGVSWNNIAVPNIFLRG